MKLKLFTFRFSEAINGFDDKAMQDFTADKEVIEYSEHFFVHENTHYLTILIAYRNLGPGEKRRRSPGTDPRRDMDDRERRAYDALRTWRAARAKQEGVPPYMIANNKQLAEIVRSKPETKAGLEGVRGIGRAKIEQYGDDILKTLANNMTDVPEDSDETKKDSDP